MKVLLTLAVAVFGFAALAIHEAHETPEVTVTLPRVVITGPSAAAPIAQLPRVTVVGYSQTTLARRNLAAGKAGA